MVYEPGITPCTTNVPSKSLWSRRNNSICATGSFGTSATITLADNRISGDSLSTSYTNATFASKNVGTAKTININGISIAGTDAANDC